MLHLSAKENNVCDTIWVAIIWSIWLHRNNLIFRNFKVDVVEILVWLRSMHGLG